MKPFQIDALRDFAIEHFPRAQKAREQAKKYSIPQEDYYRDLLVACVMAQSYSTITSIEHRAAILLEQIMLLRGGNAYEGIETRIIEVATELSGLTGVSVDWLDIMPEPVQQCIPPAPAIVIIQTSLEPGLFLTTSEAAIALNVKPQTMRTWVSKENGPIRPASKVNNHHRWLSDDIIALLNKKK